MEKSININGFFFENDEENKMYECRGEVCYDDENDEIPDPELWEAAKTLATTLKDEGHKNAQPSYSEKGWVEVQY